MTDKTEPTPEDLNHTNDGILATVQSALAEKAPILIIATLNNNTELSAKMANVNETMLFQMIVATIQALSTSIPFFDMTISSHLALDHGNLDKNMEGMKEHTIFKNSDLGVDRKDQKPEEQAVS